MANPQPASAYIEGALTRTKRVSIQALPIELLTRVFELGSFVATPDPDLGGQAEDSSESRFEILVSQVCQHWRTVALRTTTLWTLLVFREISHIDRGKAYLERSRSQTLEIFIDTVSVANHVRGVTLCRDELETVFLLLVAHVPRWKSFSLKVSDGGCKLHARKYLRGAGPAPALEKLHLYHLEDWTNSQELHVSTVNPPVLIFSGEIPRLRSVTMTGVNLPWTASIFLKNLEELELALHIKGVRPTYKEWETMLTQSPNLKRLSLHYSGPSDKETWPDKPISLPELNELSFTDLDPDYLCEVLRHLSIPNVRRLRLTLFDQDYASFVNIISRTSAPMFPRLEILHINALECSGLAWQQLLSSVPNLRFLYVDFRRSDTKAFYDALLGRDDRVRVPDGEGDLNLDLCPNLKHLKVHGLSFPQITRLVESRQRMRCPLDKVYLSEKDKPIVQHAIVGEMADTISWFYEPDEYDDEEEDGDEEDEEESSEDEDGGDDVEGPDNDEDDFCDGDC